MIALSAANPDFVLNQESKASEANEEDGYGLTALVALLLKKWREREQIAQKDQGEQKLVMLADHCFPLKGRGTIVTGTVIQGTLKLNDVIEFPELKLERKVKSMQVFHKEVESSQRGDRVAFCVPQMDSNLFERGLVTSPGFFQQILPW